MLLPWRCSIFDLFHSYLFNLFSGTGPREEWVPLRQEGDKPPQIRLAHPATLSKFKTRKRRRETAGSCLWVIGDHVDAWVNNRYMLLLDASSLFVVASVFLGLLSTLSDACFFQLLARGSYFSEL
jgi:hypothetical protein